MGHDVLAVKRETEPVGIVSAQILHPDSPHLLLVVVGVAVVTQFFAGPQEGIFELLGQAFVAILVVDEAFKLWHRLVRHDEGSGGRPEVDPAVDGVGGMKESHVGDQFHRAPSRQRPMTS